jgi:DNA-binding NarL/FixJ family response regulator
MIKVLIVDDHESMRDSLRDSISRLEGYCVVGGIASAALAEAYCRKLQPELVIMDVCTEGGASGLSAARQIREALPRIRLIIMSGFDEVTYAPRAKELGAEAFVYKHRSMDYFMQVVQGVMEGKTFYPEPRTIPLPNGEAPLTEREMEVLRLMCRHLTSAEIAQELYISERTVKYHKANMLTKTGFSKAVDLAFYMISNGWINPLY